MVGVVEDVDLAPQVLELAVAEFLDWSWFRAGSFDFDEGVSAAGEDDEAVGHPGESWGGEFEGYSAVLFCGGPKFVFDG